MVAANLPHQHLGKSKQQVVLASKVKMNSRQQLAPTSLVPAVLAFSVDSGPSQPRTLPTRTSLGEAQCLVALVRPRVSLAIKAPQHLDLPLAVVRHLVAEPFQVAAASAWGQVAAWHNLVLGLSSRHQQNQQPLGAPLPLVAAQPLQDPPSLEDHRPSGVAPALGHPLSHPPSPLNSSRSRLQDSRRLETSRVPPLGHSLLRGVHHLCNSNSSHPLDLELALVPLLGLEVSQSSLLTLQEQISLKATYNRNDEILSLLPFRPRFGKP